MLERTSAWFVDDVFTGEGIQFGDYIVPFFASNQETAEGSCVADAKS